MEHPTPGMAVMVPSRHSPAANHGTPQSLAQGGAGGADHLSRAAGVHSNRFSTV